MLKATAEAVAAFESLLPTSPGVARRPMFGQPSAFVNGNLFFGVFGSDLMLRLSETDCAAAAKELRAKPFEPMPGRPMREYVVLPPAVWKDPKKAAVWVGRSVEYASRLPAKKSKTAK